MSFVYFLRRAGKKGMGLIMAMAMVGKKVRVGSKEVVVDKVMEVDSKVLEDLIYETKLDSQSFARVWYSFLLFFLFIKKYF